MSLLDGFTPTYAFQLRIERSDRTILDTTIVAKATADEIAKAKKNVRRLLDEYTPTVRATTPAPTTPPETGTPALPEPENQVPAESTASPEPEAQPSEAAPPPPHKKPDGARGLLRLYCRECGNTFGTFLKERRSEITCCCGHHIDLTVPLALYRFTCPYCQHEGWGKTNSEDPEIEVQCKCREMITVRWNPDAREYQN